MSAPATQEAIAAAKIKLFGLVILAAVDLVVMAIIGVPT